MADVRHYVVIEVEVGVGVGLRWGLLLWGSQSDYWLYSLSEVIDSGRANPH